MNRKFEHTKRINIMVREMIEAGEYPVQAETGRGKIQQYFYYLTGKSQVDGVTKHGRHDMSILQATDIWFIDPVTGDYDWSKERYEKWHTRWIELGGNNTTVFRDGTKDYPHFDEI